MFTTTMPRSFKVGGTAECHINGGPADLTCVVEERSRPKPQISGFP